MKSYTYELPEQDRLLSLIRENLLKIGEEWREIADYMLQGHVEYKPCLLYTSPSPRDRTRSRMPSSA